MITKFFVYFAIEKITTEDALLYNQSKNGTEKNVLGIKPDVVYGPAATTIWSSCRSFFFFASSFGMEASLYTSVATSLDPVGLVALTPTTCPGNRE